MNNAIKFYDNQNNEDFNKKVGIESNYEYEMVESVSNAATSPFDAIEIIMNMAKTGKIDPWNIDVVKVYDEYMKKLKELCPEFECIPEKILESVTVAERDSSDYVTKVAVGEQTITGEEFRNHFKLNSSCFYLKEVENQVRIVTKGLGHGLGFSQYGANVLAKEGKEYKELLQYYYKDISIEKN